MNAAQLERKLSRNTGRKIAVVLTNNRHRVLTYHTHRNGGGTLRVSRIFLSADTDIVAALGAFIRGSRKAKLILQSFVDRETNRRLRRLARQGIAVQAQGAAFDLQLIYEELNYRYFAGSVNAYITWGRRRAVAGKQTVQLGAYSEAERLIRINPILDQERIPRPVLEKVVFHEMLHHVLSPRNDGRRRCLHGKEFNEFEQRYPHCDAAEKWLEKNLRVVLA